MSTKKTAKKKTTKKIVKKTTEKTKTGIIRPKTRQSRETKSKLRKVITPETTKRAPPKWTKYKKEDVEKLVVKLADEEKPQAVIGMILRDQYGIPSVKKITKESLGQILKKQGKSRDIPEDLYNLIVRAVRIQEHLSKNNRDPISRRGLELTESKIRKLAKYYRKKGKLPAEWKYIPERAKLLVK